MKLFLCLILCSVTSLSIKAFASTAEECRPKIDKARTTLLEMTGGKINPEQEKLVKDSANTANDCILSMKVTKEQEKDFTELKNVWAEFKKTRETELVPLILAGKKDEAKSIATGIQSERMGKIKRLIGKLAE